MCNVKSNSANAFTCEAWIHNSNIMSTKIIYVVPAQNN